MKKLIIISILAVVVVGAGCFYGGMRYGQSQIPAGFANRNGNNFLPQGNQQGMQRNSGGFVSGEILSKDDKSITVKLVNGGSKIVLYSEATEVGKFTTGNSQDLEIGKTVTVSGAANQDGSVTAKSIQIRPEVVPTPAQ